MKKWSHIVAGLYGLTVLALFGPMMLASFGEDLQWSQAREVFQSWQLWLMVALMILAQFALLRVPVHVASRRPVSQRPLLATVIAAAFMMGLLVFGAASSLYEFVTRLEKGSGMGLSIPVALAGWLFWALYFYRLSKRREPDRKLAHLKPYFLQGSILELLIAVPTHIIARHRDYCCAGVMTFIGLTCGTAVMLFAFGPAVYFLFVERWRRLHPNPATD